MKRINIEVVINRSGRAYISLTPSDYDLWAPKQSASKTFELAPGNYFIDYDIVTGGGGHLVITDEETGELKRRDLNAGRNQGVIDISL